MMWMLSTVLSWASGSVLDKVLSHLRARQDSGTEREKLRTQVQIKEIEAEIMGRQNARDIRLATAGFWEMRLFTALIALPFVIHVTLVGLDTNFRLGWDIAKFPAPFDQWEGAILLSFFGIYALGSSVATIAGAIANRRS